LQKGVLLMKTLVQAAVLAVALGPAAMAGPAVAEITQVASRHTVAETADALAAAIDGAGLSLAARVDHAAAASKAGLTLAPEQLLIFGNPKVGTPAMQADPRAGLFLPMRVLVYQDAADKVWLAYEDPASMMKGLAIPADAPFLATMTKALANLTAKAAGG
jgi:uncharacterized protein (DUF302 family)